MKGTNVLSTLLKKDGIKLDQENNNRETPLFIAIKNNNCKAIELLLCYDQNKKQIDINKQRGKDSYTPLHQALYKNNNQICNLLLQREDLKVNELLNKENTILHIAVILNKQEILELLLNRKDIEVNTLNAAGSTPLDMIPKDSSGNPIIDDQRTMNELLLKAQDKHSLELAQESTAETQVESNQSTQSQSNKRPPVIELISTEVIDSKQQTAN